ncbi:MAG: glycosyltransferase, partial [Ferruginibacter sp.]
QKNPEGIIQACKVLKDKGYNFELQFIGAKPLHCIELVHSLNLSAMVHFHDAVPYHDVAKHMQAADALLMFSRFENQPCIILEALCCGLPVISTNVGGISEVLNDSNGILINNEDMHSLVHAMESMIKGERTFNKKAIAQNAASKYAYATIGQSIATIYDSLVY